VSAASEFKSQKFHHSPRRVDRHSGRRPTGAHDGDGRAHHGLSRARDGPEAACPASFVADETIVGRWDDVDAARRLATGADAVTLEIEQIGVDALSLKWRALRRCARRRTHPHHPGQDAAKGVARRAGFPVGHFAWCAAKRSCTKRCRAGRTRLPEDRPRRLRRPRAGAHWNGCAATEEAIAAAWKSSARGPQLPSRLSIWTSRSA
jgi:hypothetical protein